MNILADIIIGTLVAALIGFSIFLTIRRNKKGCCSCCNNSICNKNPKAKKCDCNSKTPEDIQQ